MTTVSFGEMPNGTNLKRMPSRSLLPVSARIWRTLDREERGERTMAIATLASGCLWCTEAVVQRLRGVESVVSGYTGGAKANPTYEEVCTGRTGHAEAVQVTFDPAVISYEDLLHVYFKTHDATTLNRQGADVGTQYRSAI